MPNDPGLANDTCIFIEAISGDGGTHNANGIWWLSPDITLTGPASGLDHADTGQSNPVKVKVHRKSSASGCHFPGDESITVELWVANPSLVMAPRPGSATRVGFIGSPLPLEGSSRLQQIDWTPPSGVPADDPQSRGPKCLVARCYPDSGHASHAEFFVPTDQHVAQHNLCVVSTTTHAISFKVNVMIVTQLVPPIVHPEQIKLRAVLDLAPDQFVSNTVLRRLKSLTGFQQFRTTRLTAGFRFDLTGFQASHVVDHSQLVLTHPQTPPSFEAQVEIVGERPTPITFEANLRGVNSGEACIFHLTQSSLNNVALGGLTLVVLKL